VPETVANQLCCLRLAVRSYSTGCFFPTERWSANSEATIPPQDHELKDAPVVRAESAPEKRSKPRHNAKHVTADRRQRLCEMAERFTRGRAGKR
jgi:hypothetical protein